MSQTQNVQRGLIFMVFLHCIFLMILMIFKFCKNKIDPIDDQAQAQGGERDAKYKESSEGKAQGKESTDSIHADPNFDKVAVTKERPPDEDASHMEKFFHESVDFRNFYTPIMMLAILNIVTGTSKAFCFILYLFVVIWVALFNVAKLHRKCCGDSKFVNLFVENLWLVLTWFFFINHWAAFTVAMPYIVM